MITVIPVRDQQTLRFAGLNPKGQSPSAWESSFLIEPELSFLLGVELNAWNSGWWRTLLVPGGLVLALASVLLSGDVLSVSPAALSFYYSTVFVGGLALAWRFHSGRTFAAIILILLAHRTVEFFAGGHSAVSGPGRTALDAVSFFLALNFVWLAISGEFGFSLVTFAPRLGVLFFESVFVAAICRPQPALGSHLFQAQWLPPTWFIWTRLSQVSWLALIFACSFLAIRCALSRKQIDAGSAWALAAVTVAFSGGGVSRRADGYVATAGLLLLVSVVETSYRMAYHDELTGIPSRRALNDSIATLEIPYTVAVVDVDHFKQFNDTYGHDVGDEVLRMVARKLADVTGGGGAFRVGGEEFTILFAGRRTVDTVTHLESLRQTIEETTFRLRGEDRRLAARGAERRQVTAKPRRASESARPSTASDLRVTVSIGAAEGRQDSTFAATLERADKALYRAKHNGRNRLEIDGKQSQDNAKTTRSKKSKVRSA